MPTKLPEVTLVCIDTRNYAQAYNAILKTLEQIEPAKTIWFTDIDLNKDKRITVEKIDSLKSKEEYSKFIIKSLAFYVKTSHCLVIQWDGYCINGDSWNPKFLEYDYIGAPWLYVDGRNNGNDGFGLKSKRLLDITAKDDFISVYHPCDEVVGRLYRGYLEENYYISFAPESLAETFSFELKEPTCKTFGFHGFFHKPYQGIVKIKRKGALGDVVALQPVLEYFNNKGYRVVLDTLPDFFSLFAFHPFKVYHPGEIDGRVPEKEYNLDMAYEKTPKVNHLQAYFEACGVDDYELKRPELFLNFDPKESKWRFFKKYIVIHIDKRAQPARNIYGINWKEIVSSLKSEGYHVIQIGLNEHEDTGALWMNTPSCMMMQWLIGGASGFIGSDSGPSNIAVAMGVPSIIFFGSVDPQIIHPDLSNVAVIQKEKVCDSPKCWHKKVSTTGVPCIVDEQKPPCVQFSTQDLLEAISETLYETNVS